MSFAAIITTYKKASDYKSGIVDLEDIKRLTDKVIELANNEYGYIIIKKNSFAPPYYPERKSCSDKLSFKEVLKEIDDRYILKKLLFVILGTDEHIYSIKLTDMKELFAFIDKDTVKANVLYKINHDYKAFRK